MTRRMTSEGGYRLRHIHPTTRFASEGATTTVLGRSYGFTELPVSTLPGGEDLVEGGWTGRLGDAGEFTLSFPNAAGSKGLWRERFNPDKALEFVEIYGPDEELEFVGSIARMEIDRGMVTISGPDAWALLRRAYERDRIWTAAPQEMLNAYTRVPVAAISDDFDGSSLAANWTTFVDNTATVSGGVIRLSNSAAAINGIFDSSLSITSDAWRITVVVEGAAGISSLNVDVAAASFILANVSYQSLPSRAQMEVFDVPDEISRATPVAPSGAGIVTLTLQRIGRWLVGAINGSVVGFLAAPTANPDRLRVWSTWSAALPARLTIRSVSFTELTPFLARGADVGEYVLPGDYPPTGGLRGRYFNNADLQGLTAATRHARIMAPDREHYAERLDPVIDTSGGLTLPVQPGSGAEHFSVRWFGAVYLRGDLGNYVFETTSVDDGVRLWVGKTAFSDAIINSWVAASGTQTGTWTASAHGSTAGWYPIILDYFDDGGGNTIRLQFTPPGTTYTDPGGTSITASTKRVVPATSLSPLGCFDGRIQGQSHFDVIQQVAAQFGYQVRCEPMSLESGEFPGRLVPRARVGRDTDVVLTVEEDEHGDPILSPGTTIDSSDQTLLLIGSGSGIADGRGSQVTAEIADLVNLDAGLFVLEGVVDAGDIGQTALLEARLNAELALRSLEWQEVRGTPLAQDRLAVTWPLSAALSAMRWEPGDGVKLILPEISVEDTDPRQLLQVTRAFNGLGRTGTQVAFRQRPRSAARSLRGLVRASLVSRRSYQGQKVTLSGAFTNVVGVTTAAGAGSELSMMTLLPQDRVVRAIVRIAVNTAAQPLGLMINGTIRTSELGGPWTVTPAEIEITAYATQASDTDNRLYAQLVNNGASGTIIQLQLIVEVLR